MINLLVGLQGAGKTYYAVSEIWKHIKKMNQAEISGNKYKYKKIYTNIEGLIPNKYVETLDVSKIEKIWTWELAQYKRYEQRYNHETPNDIDFIVDELEEDNQSDVPALLNLDVEEKRVEVSTVDTIEIFDSNDEKLFQSIRDPHAKKDPEFIQKTLPEFERQGFTNCLIVIDEAHNFFGAGLKPGLKRLLSYHRHYHDQDYLLISQDHKMFNFAVCQLAAYSIRAINPIMRWRSDIFTYNIYSGGWISFSGDNKLETKSLKAKELIFNLYNSGGKVLQKSHFIKIILKLLAFILFIGVFGWYALGNFGHDNEVVVITDYNDTKRIEKVIIEDENIDEENDDEEIKTSVEEFMIVGKSIIHLKTGKKFKFSIFEDLLDEYDQPMTYTENLDGTVTVYYRLINQTLLDLNIGGKNEKSNFGYISGT